MKAIKEQKPFVFDFFKMIKKSVEIKIEPPIIESPIKEKFKQTVLPPPIPPEKDLTIETAVKKMKN